MKKMIHIDGYSGLVLEGGGMRGVFTCGVLDNFMDRGIRFPYTIGGQCRGRATDFRTCPVSEGVPSSVTSTCWRSTITSG